MGSFPRASCLLRSSYTCLLGLPFRFGAICPGVSSLFAASPVVSTVAAASQATATCRPQVFSTSRRFPPPLGFAGLFHPAATSRVSVQGFVPAPQPYRLVVGRCLLALAEFALTGCPAAARSRLDFEAFLRGSMRTSSSGFSLARRRSPLRFSPPPGSGSCTALGFPSSARDLFVGICNQTLLPGGWPRRGPSAFQQYTCWCVRLRAHPPARGSLPSFGIPPKRARRRGDFAVRLATPQIGRAHV